MTITATKQTINTGVHAAHEIDGDRVDAIKTAIEAGEKMPLALVVESAGNGAFVLDGHHRIAAYRDLGIAEIEAYVISVVDFDALIEAEFDGDLPDRLTDLDDYIIIDSEPYAGR